MTDMQESPINCLEEANSPPPKKLPNSQPQTPNSKLPTPNS